MSGQDIVKMAFDNLSSQEQEEIMHGMGICTDEVNCPADEVDCVYPDFIERGMEAHKEWQEREADRQASLITAEIIHAKERKRARFSGSTR